MLTPTQGRSIGCSRVGSSCCRNTRRMLPSRRPRGTCKSSAIWTTRFVHVVSFGRRVPPVSSWNDTRCCSAMVTHRTCWLATWFGVFYMGAVCRGVRPDCALAWVSYGRVMADASVQSGLGSCVYLFLSHHFLFSVTSFFVFGHIMVQVAKGSYCHVVCGLWWWSRGSSSSEATPVEFALKFWVRLRGWVWGSF